MSEAICVDAEQMAPRAEPAKLFVVFKPPQTMMGGLYFEFTVVPDDGPAMRFELDENASEELVAFLLPYTSIAPEQGEDE